MGELVTAQEALDAALAHGCKAEISNGRVKFSQPPPTDVLVALCAHSKEIVRLVAAMGAAPK